VRQARKAATALTLEGQHILDLYQTFKGRKVVESDATIKAANALGAVVGQDDDFLAVLAAIQADTFLNERGVRTDLDFVSRKYDGYLDAVERQRRKARLRSLPSTAMSADTWAIPVSLPTVSGRERLVVPPDIEALMESVGGGN
jgi:hypothetical protein